jgi:WD40 repeat protein
MNSIQAIPFLQSYYVPADVGRKIFNFLNVHDIVSATVTCKAWAHVITCQTNVPYWQAILLERYGILSANPYADFVLHRTFFQGELRSITTIVRNLAQNVIPFGQIELNGSYLLARHSKKQEGFFYQTVVSVWLIRSQMHLVNTFKIKDLYGRACLWMNKLAIFGSSICLHNLTENEPAKYISIEGYHTNTHNLLHPWGDKLISGDWDGNICMWNQNGECIQRIQGGGGYNAFQQVDGDELITITELGGVELFDLIVGQRKWQTFASFSNLRGVNVSKQKIVIKYRHQVMVLDRSTGAILLDTFHYHHPLQISVYDRVPSWIIHGTDTKLMLQDIRAPSFIQEIEESIAFMSVIGDRLITLSGETVKTWCLHEGCIKFEREINASVSLLYGAGEQVFYADKSNSIWKLDLGELDPKPIIIAENLSGAVTRMFFQDLKLVVTLADGTISVWKPSQSIKRRKI